MFARRPRGRMSPAGARAAYAIPVSDEDRMRDLGRRPPSHALGDTRNVEVTRARGETAPAMIKMPMIRTVRDARRSC